LASASLGTTNALFEPIHGSYPQAKKEHCKPVACILSAAMLLEHFGLHEEAKKYMTELKLQ
jgi:3-isopropylmalate dehydrogenase